MVMPLNELTYNYIVSSIAQAKLMTYRLYNNLQNIITKTLPWMNQKDGIFLGSS